MTPDAATVEVLHEALEDEYKARATYQAVIEAFGPVRPFVNIVEAEDRHARALLTLFEAFGLTPPPDRWAGDVLAPPSLREACRAGVVSELENREMYERLLSRTTHPEVVAVMKRLQQASQERHLPAFERCLARVDEGETAGRGRGRGGPGRRSGPGR